MVVIERVTLTYMYYVLCMYCHKPALEIFMLFTSPPPPPPASQPPWLAWERLECLRQVYSLW